MCELSSWGLSVHSCGKEHKLRYRCSLGIQIKLRFAQNNQQTKRVYIVTNAVGSIGRDLHFDIDIKKINKTCWGQI
jgi:hypothetical protein